MTHIITTQSYRRGTGKSTLVTNIATLLAMAGYRVGLADFNFQAPSDYIFFNLEEDDIKPTLNDYLWGECDDIIQTAHDLTPRLRLSTPLKGHLWLTTASPDPYEIIRIAQGGHYRKVFSEAFNQMSETLQLDYLIIDTQYGLNDDAIMALAQSDTLLVTLLADQQGYEGTAIILDVSASLEVPHTHLILNQVPESFAHQDIQKQFADNYPVETVTILPFFKEVTLVASSGIFVLHHPNHPLTAAFKYIANQISPSTNQ
ncbi:MAG TPA: MinD/ParA family protein [Anaerolineae bacterium]|nr:MinD/ParA family protein [Anaerolineae bacterium]